MNTLMQKLQSFLADEQGSRTVGDRTEHQIHQREGRCQERRHHRHGRLIQRILRMGWRSINRHPPSAFTNFLRADDYE